MLASLVMFFSASLWGLYWMPLRYLEDMGIEGAWAVALLNLPAAFVLLVVMLVYLPRYREYIGKVVLIGIFTGAGLALYGSSLVLSSVVRATLLFYLTPIWATVIGMLWLGERAAWQRWLAITIGLLGMILLLSGGSSVPLNIGDLFALLSGMTWAIGAAMIMRFEGVPVPGMVGVQFVITSLFAIALGVITATASVQPPEPSMLMQAAAMLLGISLLMFLPAVCLIFWAQKYLFPGRAGLLMMSEAVMAVLSASLLLPEEQMSLIAWIGAALIICACLVEVLLSPSQESASDTPTPV